jgi:hypothetical protein
MKFGKALEELKADDTEGTFFMQHKKWDKNMKVGIKYPDLNSMMTEKYLYQMIVGELRNRYIPWTPNQSQLFSDKWEIVF